MGTTTSQGDSPTAPPGAAPPKAKKPPGFLVTMPDGQRFEVRDESGKMTQDQAWDLVKQHYTPPPRTITQKAGDLVKGTVQAAADIPYGLGLGVLQTGKAGAELGADLIQDTGIGGNKWGDTVRQYLEGAVPKPEDKTQAVASKVGEFGSQMLLAPAAKGVKGAAAIGGIVGALQPQESSDIDERNLGRLKEGAVGAAGGATLQKAADFITKLVNSREIQSIIGPLQKRYRELNPVLAPQRAEINDQVSLLKKRFSELGNQALEKGDSLGPIDMKILNTEDKLRDIVDGAEKSLNPNTKALKILRQAESSFVGNAPQPRNIVVGGLKFTRQADGTYADPLGVNKLSGKTAQSVINQYTGYRQPPVKYSQLKQGIEEMDAFLRDNTKAASNPAVKAVKDARELLQTRLNSFKTTSVDQAEKKATSFYEENLSKFDQPQIKSLLTESDPLKRADRAISIAEGNDEKLAETALDVIGPKGADAVREAVMARALQRATDSDGVIDPARFVKYFDNRPGWTKFQNGETELNIQGISKLLDADARLHGQTATKSISTPLGHYGMVGAGVELFRGDWKNAAIMATAAGAIKPTIKMFNQMMGSQFGRTLLAAAATTRPGSPRMARILEQSVRRFGPAAAGTLGNSAVPSEGQ